MGLFGDVETTCRRKIAIKRRTYVCFLQVLPLQSIRQRPKFNHLSCSLKHAKTHRSVVSWQIERVIQCTVIGSPYGNTYLGMLTILASLTAATTGLRDPLALLPTVCCARQASGIAEGGNSFSLKVHTPIQPPLSLAKRPFSASQSWSSIGMVSTWYMVRIRLHRSMWRFYDVCGSEGIHGFS